MSDGEVARGKGVVLFRRDGELWVEIDWSVWKGWWIGVAGGTRFRHIPRELSLEVDRLTAQVRAPEGIVLLDTT